MSRRQMPAIKSAHGWLKGPRELHHRYERRAA
jgi:hypothetical protein